MTSIEKIRTLKEGLEAICRWLSPGQELLQHIDGDISTQELSRQHYGNAYIADILAIRRAVAVKE